jgi:hypothetical protein
MKRLPLIGFATCAFAVVPTLRISNAPCDTGFAGCRHRQRRHPSQGRSWSWTWPHGARRPRTSLWLVAWAASRSTLVLDAVSMGVFATNLIRPGR